MKTSIRHLQEDLADVRDDTIAQGTDPDGSELPYGQSHEDLALCMTSVHRGCYQRAEEHVRRMQSPEQRFEHRVGQLGTHGDPEDNHSGQGSQ